MQKASLLLWQLFVPKHQEHPAWFVWYVPIHDENEPQKRYQVTKCGHFTCFQCFALHTLISFYMSCSVETRGRAAFVILIENTNCISQM